MNPKSFESHLVSSQCKLSRLYRLYPQQLVQHRFCLHIFKIFRLQLMVNKFTNAQLPGCTKSERLVIPNIIISSGIRIFVMKS